MRSGALNLNTTASNNTATGIRALELNTTGNNNTATGRVALSENTTGTGNTAMGARALIGNTTGSDNTAAGLDALRNNTIGHSNAASGQSALSSNTIGIGNTAIGRRALERNSAGNDNTALGRRALINTTGNRNIGIGFEAGIGVITGDNNIYIDNSGQDGESNATRIGRVQARTFISGISGVTTDLPTGSAVLIDTQGQLGTVLSSRRFKQDIHDMSQASSALMSLRPVTFHYKKAYANGERHLQYGLIAEEVAEVYPELVVKNEEGQVQTVQYHKLNSMLLNEVQKQHRLNQEQVEQIHQQRQEIADLTERLARLEQVLTAQRTLAALAK